MVFGKRRSKIKFGVLAIVAVVGLSAAAAPASAGWGISFGSSGFNAGFGNGGYYNGGYRSYGNGGYYNRGSYNRGNYYGGSYNRGYGNGYSHWTPGRGWHSHGYSSSSRGYHRH